MSLSSWWRPQAPRRRQTRKYRSENSMELLRLQEPACYRCGRTRIGVIEPFTGEEHHVAPSAVASIVFTKDALLPKACLGRHALRGAIRRLDVQLHAHHTQVIEGIPARQFDRASCMPSTPIRR